MTYNNTLGKLVPCTQQASSFETLCPILALNDMAATNSH
jgi:hypothetical protein